MSNPNATPTAHAYRAAVALSAATGGAISPIAFMAFGTSNRPYSAADDVEVYGEVARVAAVAVANGPEVSVKAVLKGSQAGDSIICNVGAFTASGVLVGRAVVKPKEFEETSELEIEMIFEY